MPRVAAPHLSYRDVTLRGMTRSKRLDEIALTATLRTQRNVIARWQALNCGMTRRALEHRIRAGGPWQRLLPGLVAYSAVPNCGVGLLKLSLMARNNSTAASIKKEGIQNMSGFPNLGFLNGGGCD